jgi:hypothetical protein
MLGRAHACHGAPGRAWRRASGRSSEGSNSSAGRGPVGSTLERSSERCDCGCSVCAVRTVIRCRSRKQNQKNWATLDRVTVEQAAGLAEQAVEPLAADPLYPAWRAPSLARQEIEERADAHRG